MTLLEFKRNVTMGLLTEALNAKRVAAGRAGRLAPVIQPSAEPGAKRRKMRLSVRDDVRFSGVGIHLPVFGNLRGRCEWCQATTDTKLESRPYSKCQQCNIFLCLGKKRNCFVEFHDERYFAIEDPEDEAPLPGVEAVYSSSEESDGQASDHEPNDGVYTSSSSDSDEADRNQVIVCPSFDDEYDEFQE